MKSVMSHQFSQVPNVQIPRSSFDRSHGHKSAFNGGVLVPILVDEALPGDTFNCSMAAFARMSTPIFPVMDNLYMDTQFFSVPIRLVWDNFQKFMGEQDNPGDSTSFLVPTATSPATTGYAFSSPQDYMGIPPGIPDLEHSNLFARAYNLIWNEWYRDQNLQDSVVVDKDDGPDDPTDYNTLLRRGKRHDYFTSALPWPQKGDAVDLPLGDTAPIQGTGGVTQVFSSGDATVRDLEIQTSTGDIQSQGYSGATADLKFTADSTKIGLEADLSAATAATINQLRQAFQIQKLLERDARGGTRYVEIVKSHFGVTTPSAGWRTEYLGGGSSPVNINPVYTTADTTSKKEVGDAGAYSVTAIRSNGFTKSFTEHCLIIGLVSVRADLTYQQGLNRMFSRSTRYDFYWPSLSHIGEQSILNKEIYAQGSLAATDDDVFGYQERYGEYRYKPSIITSVFRSASVVTLDSWHLSQEFTSLPTLGDTFIQENPPISRVISAVTEPHFIFDSYFKMRCARPMPLYGVPGMIDHF